ncbi:MAG: hypothetical protein ACI97X_002230, partial [Oceanospirillaceae bacterium]
MAKYRLMFRQSSLLKMIAAITPGTQPANHNKVTKSIT